MEKIVILLLVYEFQWKLHIFYAATVSSTADSIYINIQVYKGHISVSAWRSSILSLTTQLWQATAFPCTEWDAYSNTQSIPSIAEMLRMNGVPSLMNCGKSVLLTMECRVITMHTSLWKAMSYPFKSVCVYQIIWLDYTSLEAFIVWYVCVCGWVGRSPERNQTLSPTFNASESNLSSYFCWRISDCFKVFMHCFHPRRKIRGNNFKWPTISFFAVCLN